MRKREVWIDNVKVIACILVVLGHFFQSMVKSAVITENNIFNWFNISIYYFHVPLFFICSGYIYQKLARVNDLKSYGSNVLKKFINLGIPYFVFEIITTLLKIIFEGSKNIKGFGEFFDLLFLNPVPPYWYLYALFFIFVFTPTAKNNRDMKVIFLIALIIKGISFIQNLPLPYAIGIVFINEIWFAIGMAICKFNLQKRINIKILLIGCLFIPFSFISYKLSFENSIFNNLISFNMGLLGCTFVISIIFLIFKDNIQNNLFGFAAKYTMPIFLMHTIFAAGIRSVLLKLGITSSFLQITIGLATAFLCPIIAAVIMDKSKYLNIFLYPSKVIKI